MALSNRNLSKGIYSWNVPCLEISSNFLRVKLTAPSVRKSHTPLRGFDGLWSKAEAVVLLKDEQVGAAFFLKKLPFTSFELINIPVANRLIADLLIDRVGRWVQ
jgi:hypothetical protein